VNDLKEITKAVELNIYSSDLTQIHADYKSDFHGLNSQDMQKAVENLIKFHTKVLEQSESEHSILQFAFHNMYYIQIALGDNKIFSESANLEDLFKTAVNKGDYLIIQTTFKRKDTQFQP
jgi:hypothetical protein